MVSTTDATSKHENSCEAVNRPSDRVAHQQTATELHARALVWDQHGCLPLHPTADAVEELEVWRAGGVDYVSINVGFDLTTGFETLKTLSAFRRGLRGRPDTLVLAATAADVVRAKADRKLAVTFDLEGTEPLDGQLSLLESFYALGVRTALIAYNSRNRAGGGCHDDPSIGLSKFGTELVREMNELGIIVDASHCSRQTTFDLCKCSSSPIVFSHSVPEGVWRHERNVTDDQMRACAATGGVVGINGLGIFLGPNDASTEAFIRAIEYAMEVIGVGHVGIGLDYVTEAGQRDLITYLEENSDVFPVGSGYREYGPVRFVSPTQLPDVTALLLERGHAPTDIEAILGGNFFRVATEVWKA